MPRTRSSKFYTIGPMFRRERPQKGRYRQFYQIDAEIFGVEAPYADVELIFLLHTLFARLKVTDATAHINSLGCPACRPHFTQALTARLNAAATGPVQPTAVRRKARNPLRVLDCKVPACREAMRDAPSIVDYLCDDCRRHFDTVATPWPDSGCPHGGQAAGARPGLLHPHGLRDPDRGPGRPERRGRRRALRRPGRIAGRPAHPGHRFRHRF